MIAALARAADAAEVARGESLLDRLRDLEARALAILDTAQRAKKYNAALGAIREMRSVIELLARLHGELESEGTTVIVASPEWLNLRGRLLLALDPFPEARDAVIRALGEDEVRNENGVIRA